MILGFIIATIVFRTVVNKSKFAIRGWSHHKNNTLKDKNLYKKDIWKIKVTWMKEENAILPSHDKRA